MALCAVVEASINGVGEVDAYLLCGRWISSGSKLSETMYRIR